MSDQQEVPSPQKSDLARGTRSRRLIVVSALLLLGLVWAVALQMVLRDRRQAVETESAMNQNLAQAQAGRVSSELQRLDQAMLALRDALVIRGRPIGISERLAAMQVKESFIGIVTLIDEHGDVIESTEKGMRINFADRAYFKAHAADPTDRLLIGQAIRGRQTGRWLIPLSRRLSHPDGSFAGVVFLALGPEVFATEFELTDVGPHGVLALLGQDGGVRVSRNAGRVSFGEEARGLEFLQELPGPAAGHFVAPQSAQGPARVVSYARLPSHALVMVVASSMDDVLDELRPREITYLLTAALVSVFLVLLSRLLYRDVQAYERTLATTRRNEASLRAMIDAAPIPMAMNDDHGNITFLNRSFTETFGYRQYEIPVLTTWWDKAYPDPDYRRWVIETWGAELQRAQQSGQPFTPMEVKLRSASGEEKTVVASATTFPASFVGEHVVVLFDLTARKKLENARMEALDRLQRIASRVPGVVYEYLMRPDGSSCFPFASEAIREVYRVSPEQVRTSAKPVSDVLHPDDYDLVIQSIANSARDLTPWQQEYRVRFPDGVVRWLSGNAVAQAAPGGGVLWHGFITDITERRRLDESARQLAQAVEQSPESIVITDVQARIEYVNDAFLRTTGYAREELLGRNPRLLQSGKTLKKTYDDMWSTLLQGRAWSGELVNRRRDGSEFIEMAIIAPLRNPQGTVTHYVAVKENVTAHRQTEDELRQQTLQLKALSNRVLEVQEAERRRLAIELHDELGQSLTAIKINLQSSARFKGQTLEDQNAENIRIIEDALQQVRRLALALRPSLLDDLGLMPALNWMGEQSSSRGGFVVKCHSVRLQDRLAPEIETACFRIVQEALTNISRYANASKVDIQLLRDGEMLVLEIRDDGRGFDVSAMREGALAGGSLGLLGMEERATLIGGQLSIESRPGHGSLLRMTCPLRLRGQAA